MLALLAAGVASVDHWAVLVAGSSGYGNYRHQADVCHAYQTVLSKGIPASNIIVMAVDDIANSRENPFPGKIFNKPTPSGTPGTDVYAGCKIDWSGKDVTPANFVKVLTGAMSSTNGTDDNSQCKAGQREKCASSEACCCTKSSIFFGCQESSCCDSAHTCSGSAGCVAPSPSPSHKHKVLGSGKTSKVFINFVDHGGVGLIGFPESVMHVKELGDALKTMHEKGMYKELVFYLEACESGSMFPDGTLQPNMYATTAANAKESSWGTYCSPQDKVDGKSIGSCLGDLYSVMWMEDSDKGTAKESLEQQFTKVKQETTKSHVTEFGDKTVAAEPLVDFQGDKNLVELGNDDLAELARTSAMDSRDAELASAYQRFMSTGSSESAHELQRYVAERAAATARFNAITRAVGINGVEQMATPEQIDVKCHYAAHLAYVSSCGEWTTGALKHSATLAKLCVATHGDVQPIRAAIQAACA